MLSHCVLHFSVGEGAFVKGLSKISFFSLVIELLIYNFFLN